MSKWENFVLFYKNVMYSADELLALFYQMKVQPSTQQQSSNSVIHHVRVIGQKSRYARHDLASKELNVKLKIVVVKSYTLWDIFVKKTRRSLHIQVDTPMHSGQKWPLAAHPESCLGLQKNALNSAIFGPILNFVVYTHILGCGEHIFGKKLKIGRKLQNLRHIIIFQGNF